MAIQTFTAAQVLTAAQMNALQANDYNQTVNTSTTSYVLVASDKGTRRVMNSASATTITVNTSLFSAGDTLVLQNIGAGVCTVTAGTATVSSAGPLAIPQNGGGLLYFTSAGVSIYYPSAVTAAAASLASATAQTNSSQTTSSTTYADLATVTSVTLTTGTSAFAFFHASSTHNELSGSTFISCAVSGASTVAASDDFCALNQAPSASAGKQNLAGGHIFTGLTAGSNTFTIKYRVGGGGQTGTFDYRGIQVISL